MLTNLNLLQYCSIIWCDPIGDQVMDENLPSAWAGVRLMPARIAKPELRVTPNHARSCTFFEAAVSGRRTNTAALDSIKIIVVDGSGTGEIDWILRA